MSQRPGHAQSFAPDGPLATQPAASTSRLPASEKRIVKLAEATINRIAAGEVVQRPSSALKELLENSIDAGSTNIKVTVKEGGLKLLSIQDNGHGIQKADLPLLCERFATSKLKTYDDLSSIATYGFRGEALASISHVAHLTVTTKTRQDGCGYKARYLDGKLVPLIETSKDCEPRPVAANDGTLLLVEDLFYNTPTRRKGLRSAADEYARILDVVSKYAIHNAGIAMSCKKATSTSSDLNTVVSASTLDVIGLVYSEAVRKELLELRFKNEAFAFECSGCASSPNYSAKRGIFVFFINHRLVDCAPLRKNLESFYQTLLPKGGCPFIYLSLNIQPDRVDVNVSPTKSEVHFLDQEDIIEAICEELQRKLASANQSRSFTVQTLLPGVLPPTHSRSTSIAAASVPSAPPLETRRSGSASNKVPAQRLVRTDASAQTLDAMFGQASANSNTITRTSRKRSATEIVDVEAEAEDEIIDVDNADNDDTIVIDNEDSLSKYRDGAASASIPSNTQKPRQSRVPLAQTDLTSIQELRAEVTAAKHDGLERILKQHTFVGTIDVTLGQSMLQHGTKLYLVNHNMLGDELFYQVGLRQFGSFGKLHLKPPPSLRELLEIAVEGEPNSAECGMSPEQIVDVVYARLTDRAEMLDEYFSLSIDTNVETVKSLPMLLPGWAPDLDKLPLFLLRLGVEVDWTSEKECFQGILREMAFFNSPEALPPVNAESADDIATDKDKQDKRMWQVEHVLFPALRYLEPPESLLDSKAAVHVASLENLYKVFERC